MKDTGKRNDDEDSVTWRLLSPPLQRREVLDSNMTCVTLKDI